MSRIKKKFICFKKNIFNNKGSIVIELIFSLAIYSIIFLVCGQCFSMIITGIQYRYRQNLFFQQRAILERYLEEYSKDVETYSIANNYLYIKNSIGSITISQGDKKTNIVLSNGNSVELNSLNTIDFKEIDKVNVKYFQGDAEIIELVDVDNLIEVIATLEAKDKELDYVLTFNKKIYLER